MKRSRMSAVLMTALLFGAFVAVAAEQDKAITRSFSVGNGGRLDVDVSGGTIIVTGSDRGDVAVRVTGVDAGDRDRIDISQDGNTVRIRDKSRWGNNGDVEVKVGVPSHFDLNLRTAGGDITINGPLTGQLEGATSGGDIRLGVLGGKLGMTTSGGDIRAEKFDGDFTVTTSGGDIRVGSITGEGRVITSGGDVHVEKAGKNLVASTSGGDITIGDVGGDAKVSTSGGDLRVGKVTGEAKLSTAGGDVTLQGANGKVTATSSGGDLMLEGITGSLKGSTAGGNITASLIPSGSQGSKLATAGGDILLRVPGNAKATVRAHIRLERWGSHNGVEPGIISDFNVENLEKTDRDISGTVNLNGGGEEIVLETVNGKIEIRKLH